MTEEFMIYKCWFKHVEDKLMFFFITCSDGFLKFCMKSVHLLEDRYNDSNVVSVTSRDYIPEEGLPFVINCENRAFHDFIIIHESHVEINLTSRTFDNLTFL